MTNRTIIIGAGIAGLSAAYHLQQEGADWELFEKEPEVGGMLRSTEIDGFTFDPACYVLHGSTPYTKTLIKGLLGDNLVEHERSAWVYSHGVYTRYPFQSHLYGLPTPVVQDCLLGLCGERWRTAPGDNFEDWAINTFGKGIADHFMLPYNRKMWGVDLKEMVSDWTQDRVAIPTYIDVLAGALEDTGADDFGLNARFMYPKQGGIGALPKALAGALDGQHIHLGTEVTEIDSDLRGLRVDSDWYEYDNVISTAPLGSLDSLFVHRPGMGAELRYIGVLCLRLGIKREDVSDKHWVYFPEEHFCFHRVSFPSNFSNGAAPDGCSSIVAEATTTVPWCVNSSGLADRFAATLAKARIIGKEDEIAVRDLAVTELSYPIHDKAREGMVKAIKDFLRSYNIFTCGRWGDWEYDNIDQAILSGKRAAEEVMATQ